MRQGTRQGGQGQEEGQREGRKNLGSGIERDRVTGLGSHSGGGGERGKKRR